MSKKTKDSLEELRAKISRLKAALEREKDSELRGELQRLLSEYEVALKQIQRTKWLKVGMLSTALLIVGIVTLLFFMFIRDSSSFKDSQNSGAVTTSTSTTEAKTTETTTESDSDKVGSNQGEAVFPAQILGTWYRKSNFSDDIISLTFYENGQVKAVTSAGTQEAQVTGLKKVGNNTYRYVVTAFSYSNSPAALVPEAQLGGVGVKYDYGIRIDGNSILPLVWQTGSNQAFDYSKPLSVTEDSYKYTREKPVASSDVDTKNLTTQQVNDWAISTYLKDHTQGQFTKNDYFIDSWKDTGDGLVYITIKENHSTDNMKEAGADPNTVPTVGRYRVSASGYLEESRDSGQSWEIASKVFTE